jgi:hypothetical protein
MEDQKIKLIQEKVGEYKDFMKKLQDLTLFKEHTLQDIKKENETHLKTQLEQATQHLTTVLKDLTSKKTDTINETLGLLKQREEQLTEYEELLQKHTKQLTYLLEHTDILMMKLVNRGVLNEHDVVELNRRATKKADTTD